MIGKTNSIHLGIALDILWTNPNPTSNFAAQTVALDLSEYTHILIQSKFNASTAMGGNMSFMAMKVGNKGITATKNLTSGTMNGRTATVSETGVQFTTGYSGSTGGAGYAIPCIIYGVRGIPTYE